jgi:hypothetical protein
MKPTDDMKEGSLRTGARISLLVVAMCALLPQCARYRPVRGPTVEGGAVMLKMPRTICSDADKPGTAFDAAVFRYEPFDEPTDQFPDGTTARVVIRGYGSEKEPMMTFDIVALSVHGRAYVVHGGRANSEVEGARPSPAAGHSSSTLCYLKGSGFLGDIPAVVLP